MNALFKQAVASTVSSRRYEMLVSDEMSDPDDVRSILEEEQGVLMQDNNCKLLTPKIHSAFMLMDEWLDEVNVIEAEVLKRLSDGETLDWVFLK